MDKTAEILFQYLRDVLYSPKAAALDVDALPEDFQKLGAGLAYLGNAMGEARALCDALAKGKLNVELPSPGNELASPLKSLHASLKHLSWQSQQVAKGDYRQRVDFMGEFSEAFNTMVSQLDSRQKALEEEIEQGKQKAVALEQSVDLFEAVTARVAQWILVVERGSGEFLFCNGKAEKALQAGGDWAKRLRTWLAQQTAEAGGEGIRELDLELLIMGKRRYFAVTCYPLVWRRRQALAYVLHDVSDEKRRVQRLEDYAFSDNLTRLYNRHYGMGRLNKFLKEGRLFSICFADLDNLKYVNDTYGHSEGDRYLVAAADLMRNFGEGAVVSRLGGDEFMVLWPGMTGPHTEQRMETLRERMMEPSGKVPYVRSISYGVVEVPPGNKYSSSELLETADERMYAFKRANKRRGVNLETS